MEAGQTIHPGDLCSHGGNRLPLYRVIHVYGDKAWLRDVNSGVDGVVEVGTCVRVEDEAGVPDAPPHQAPATGPLSEPPAGPPMPHWRDGSEGP